MAHPYRSAAKATTRTKFKAISGKSGSGTGNFGESQLSSAKTRVGERREAGKVQGEKSRPRIDKRASGGKALADGNSNPMSSPRRIEQQDLPPLASSADSAGAPAPSPGSLPFPAQGGGGPIPRKSGGLVKMTGGAEGGLGRLQKAANAKRMRGG